ncbi:hypothetical protein [Cylindrospermum sp. FACHB-282]|uniref:hypothetical protein n=1 Tax=Cylindrospermum sp. FACHB-282 TaxID=2692794 RepID=UPI00168366EA|nr:hypothetical protein [Cylindrospermum sp. FACHB-282]MBD2385518.1 hypothetical protein [Cylindrospermum sp. FACHB-282]
MFSAKKGTKYPQCASTNYNYREVEIYPSALVEQLSDATAEKVCGGAINTPETTAGENKSEPPAKVGNDKAIPLGIGYGGLGKVPFYSPLPPTKLPRLGGLDPSTRTSPKNAITITIPLPTF